MMLSEFDKDVKDKAIQFAIDIMQLDESENPMLEAYNDKEVLSFQAEIMDQDKFIKRNDIKEITNPVFFVRAGVPTPDGLLSNEIFGITKDERAGIYGYIDLHGTFIDPSVYKAMIKLDSNIKKVVHGIGKWKLDSNGYFVEDENGSCGIDFIKANIDKIKFKDTGSSKRDLKIEYIKKNKDRMFIKKLIVIPAYYRDVASTSGNTSVGFINKMYSSLISLASAPKEADYYGLSKSNAAAGRIQETILAIYDYLSGNTNAMISDKDQGVGLQGKFGIIRRAVTSKTADYSCRLVITAQDIKQEKVADSMVSLDKTAIPLSAAMTIFYPYMLFNMKRFFEYEFPANSTYPCMLKGSNEVVYKHVKDPQIEFSDERLTAEMKKFLHGYSNRLSPIEVPIEDDEADGHVYYMQFKGVSAEPTDHSSEAINNRRLTWVDVFYMAAVEACKDKVGLITRYPMDSRYNQFPSGLVVSATIKTEDMMVNDTHYKYYPMIRESDIGSDTSSMFVDSLVMSNLYLPAIGGDYDGDQVTIKGVYTVESNDELKAYMNTKANYVNLGGRIIRSPSKEAIISMYSLTMIPDNIANGVLTDPIF